MPAAHTIDPVRRLVTSRAWGVLTDADLLNNKEKMMSDPAFDPALSQLWDFTLVTELAVTGEGVRSLAMMKTPFSASARRAIVVGNDAQHGMVRMFTLAGGREDNDMLRVVRDVDAAREWLGEGEVAEE